MIVDMIETHLAELYFLHHGYKPRIYMALQDRIDLHFQLLLKPARNQYLKQPEWFLPGRHISERIFKRHFHANVARSAQTYTCQAETIPAVSNMSGRLKCNMLSKPSPYLNQNYLSFKEKRLNSNGIIDIIKLHAIL